MFRAATLVIFQLVHPALFLVVSTAPLQVIFGLSLSHPSTFWSPFQYCQTVVLELSPKYVT